MSDQDRRHTILRDVLRRNQVQSQVELLSLLAAEGLKITQATLSRDLRSIGAIKGPEGYQPPASSTLDRAGKKRVAALLRDHVVSIHPAGNMLVIRTTRNRAMALAEELDTLGLPGLLGTIGGQDTIFLATAASGQARRLQGELARISGRSEFRP